MIESEISSHTQTHGSNEIKGEKKSKQIFILKKIRNEREIHLLSRI